MKKTIFLTILILGLSLTSPPFSYAQGMVENGHTASEEAEGKEIWKKLQAKELNCENLSDDDFGALGMYFMGLMTGESHEAMDKMMNHMMGKKSEEQMHIAMGKRTSSCKPNAPMPQGMMGGGMMRGGGSYMMGMGDFGANSMSWSSFGFGWIFMVLFWILVILGIIALIKWLMIQGGGKTQEKSALDILKERYAKGEIGKKEFDEKKKDLI